MAFHPEPVHAVSEPRQLKAFSDPIRLRIISILSQQAATNRQLAGFLDEPQAKVLHHVRFLLDAGLIRLVETRARGGNLEKYYRAIARGFVLQPGVPEGEEPPGSVTGAVFEALRQEALASIAAWPGHPVDITRRAARISDEQLEAFRGELVALLDRYWADSDDDAAEVPRVRFLAAWYRDPADGSP